jgi:hypothetical protein
MHVKLENVSFGLIPDQSTIRGSFNPINQYRDLQPLQILIIFGLYEYFIFSYFILLMIIFGDYITNPCLVFS